MCRAGGRRCPGQYDPAKAAARNAKRRAQYAAKKGSATNNGGGGGEAQGTTAKVTQEATPSGGDSEQKYTVDKHMEKLNLRRKYANEVSDLEDRIGDAERDYDDHNDEVERLRARYEDLQEAASVSGSEEDLDKADEANEDLMEGISNRQEVDDEIANYREHLSQAKEDLARAEKDLHAFEEGMAKETEQWMKDNLDEEESRKYDEMEAAEAEQMKRDEEEERAAATATPKLDTSPPAKPEPHVSSSRGYEYKNAVPEPEEMRRSVPVGAKFSEYVAPGDYVRHLDDYVKVDSYSESERGVTLNEGQETEMFIPKNDLYDKGKVLLRSRPGTNDGADYNEDDHFDEPELRAERPGAGYDDSDSYDDFDDFYPDDEEDFSDDLDPDDLGDPYGDRDYGDEVHGEDY